MSVDFEQIINNLSAITLDGPGRTTAELRRSIAAYAADLSLGETADNSQIPTDLVPYLDKVSLYAYKVLDRNVDALKDNNYNEDEIFELTISAALGAGLARLNHGLTLLNE
jgi:hypothetical protein